VPRLSRLVFSFEHLRHLQAAARQGVANAKAARVAKRIAEVEVAKLALGDGCERLARTVADIWQMKKGASHLCFVRDRLSGP